MECKVCLMTDELTHIGDDGICDFCKMHEKLEGLTGWDEILLKVRKQKGYQCLIGISGGFDSSYLLLYTVEVLGLKPLVLHFNNGWNDPIAEFNMSLLVETLGVDLIRLNSDDEYDLICGAFLEAGLKDADIANDMYMADMMQTVALKYNIKYIFNGHDFRYEGSTPLCWTYMDAKYMQSVYKWAYGRKLNTPYLQTFWKQIWMAIKGIQQIRVYHYVDIPLAEKISALTEVGFIQYKEKHGENVYTKFIGYELLPKKWGIDKRKVYLSAQVRSGYLTKGEAEEELTKSVEVDIDYDDLRWRTGISYDEAMSAPKHTYKDFDHYNFKRFKPLLWLLAKLNLIAYTFYKKYTW